MRIVKSNKAVKATKEYPKYIDRDGYTGTFVRVDPGVDGEEIPIYKFPGGESMADDAEIANGYNVKASKQLSANDQALQHIKAAIDILGKSGMKDDVTKDSIANLGIVAMDIKSSIES